MEAIEQLYQTSRLRMIGSVLVFALFVMLAGFQAITGNVMSDDVMLLWMIPLVASFIALPSGLHRKSWPQQSDPSLQDRMDFLRESLREIETRAMYTRFAYGAIAAFVLSVLPLADF